MKFFKIADNMAGLSKKIVKKFAALVLTISCGCLGTSLLNAALTEEINAKVELTKEWQIDSSEDNKLLSRIKVQ